MASRSKWSHERDWTEVEARQVLAACEASGLSMRAFAFREGLRPRPAGRKSPAVSFVPAVVRIDPPGLASRAAITIRVGTRATMEMYPSANGSPEQASRRPPSPRVSRAWVRGC